MIFADIIEFYFYNSILPQMEVKINSVCKSFDEILSVTLFEVTFFEKKVTKETSQIAYCLIGLEVYPSRVLFVLNINLSDFFFLTFLTISGKKSNKRTAVQGGEGFVNQNEFDLQTSSPP